jgi:hypothetical protein
MRTGIAAARAASTTPVRTGTSYALVYGLLVVVIGAAYGGIGLPSPLRFGDGLTSMRERAAELGGTCVIAPRASGGTLVTARLPLVAGSTSDQARAPQRAPETSESWIQTKSG